MTPKLRIAIFGLIFVLCITASVTYVWRRARQLENNVDNANAKTGLIITDEVDGGSSVSLPKSRFVIFRNTAFG